VNAVMSDAAASDDSDLRSIAHIGTIVSTTAIAMAERTGAGGRDVLAAMVLGYEIAGRIDEALTPGRGERGFHGSISTIFGGAVAAGTLIKLTPTQMTQAIALASTSIGGLMVAANTSVAREYHAGLSAMLGIHAALAAHKGYVAEENVLEVPRGFFSVYGGDHLEDVTKDLGTSWDITTDMAIKLVPGGHPHHAAAEAAANAAIAGDVDPHDVASIVLSSAKYRTLPGPKHPTDLIGIAHSPAYFIAAAIADRGYGWSHASPEKVTDPVIAQLIDKITVDRNPPPYPDRFAHHHGATVTITLRDGRRFSDHVDFPRGSAPRGIDWADVDAKYRRLVPLSGLGPEKVEASLEVVHGFDTVKAVSELTRLLRTPRTRRCRRLGGGRS
jgi:2-methylcitrate dehydratase PrpD